MTETGHKIIFRIMRYKVPADEEEEKHEHDIRTEKQ